MASQAAESALDTLFDCPSVSEELGRMAAARGWPAGLLERMVRLRWPRGSLEWWLSDAAPPVEVLVEHVADRERLTHGTLRSRPATYDDGEAVSELYANAPERIGDWEVTVERGPNAFAQFSLQEHPQMQVLEDRGVLLGAFTVASRNSFVGGRRLSVMLVAGWRTHRLARRQGFSRLIRNWGPVLGLPFAPGQYWYIRSQNREAVAWMDALDPTLLQGVRRPDDDVPGVPVTVHQYAARAFDGDAAGIRRTRRGDSRRCVALVNRTHRGLDLFRPYTLGFLEDRLDEGFWGPRPPWWTSVYTWDDHWVVEREGAVVACAGLWDRGRDVREVWRHRETGEERRVTTTNLLDFGHAPGHEGDLGRLIAFLAGRTAELGRGALTAPLQFLPAVEEAATAAVGSPAAVERRGLAWRMWGPEGDQYAEPPVQPERPYTDLAYW